MLNTFQNDIVIKINFKETILPESMIIFYVHAKHVQVLVYTTKVVILMV